MRYFIKSWPYLLLLCLASFGHFVYADFHGPYLGRVLDKDTKQPIEGGAVLAVWRQVTPGTVHDIESVHDAQETLTDLNGNFTIPGILTTPIDPRAKIKQPTFIIFKPEYQAYGGWRLTQKLAPQGKDGRHVVELRRLTTKDERLKNLDRISVSSRIPLQKYPHLVKLRNIERGNLGLKPTHIPKGVQP